MDKYKMMYAARDLAAAIYEGKQRGDNCDEMIRELIQLLTQRIIT